MAKIKKQKKAIEYAQHRVYKETSDKLAKISRKSGLYIIEILASLVDVEFDRQYK
jgi:hypothetical protein